MQKGFEIDMFGYEPEFVVCGDARIAYYDVGRGKPLVLLHGNGEDSSYWNAPDTRADPLLPRYCGGQPWARRLWERRARPVV
mgnify:CR=1 FL=1